MKKYFAFIIVCLFLLSNRAFAEVFDNISNLTETQKEQLTKVHDNYKEENNKIETQIMDFNSKLLKIKAEKDKTDSDIQILTSAYQRNIDSLKEQQKELTKKFNEDYKSILTEEQYKQYELQLEYAQSAFTKFLQK